MNNFKQVAIIGAGAAGLMAGATILEKNKNTKIYLIEKNKSIGNKVLLTGGGRCNLTTGIFDVKEILKKYPRGSNFIKYAMHQFSPKYFFDWFEKNGLKLKIESDLRVFPVSNKSTDVVNVFEKKISSPNVVKIFSGSITDIKKNKNKFSIHFKDNKKIDVDNILLSTGSSVDGYKFAKNFGHTVTKLSPSLSGFSTEEDAVKQISGIAFKDVKIKLNTEKNEFIYRGPFLFTHKGISGPCIFALSALSAHEDIKRSLLFIDFFPDKNYEILHSEFQKLISSNIKKDFSFVLSKFIPKSFAEIFLSILSINKKCFELSKKDINKTIELLKNFKLSINGKIRGDEFVTAGGINLSEIDSKTMESKICPGLYFAGEILDVDGFTGGFNLQAAWATGRVAGENM